MLNVKFSNGNTTKVKADSYQYDYHTIPMFVEFFDGGPYDEETEGWSDNFVAAYPLLNVTGIECVEEGAE